MDYTLFLEISGITGLLLSIIFLIIHLYKFLKTNTRQTLATRNLTIYCLYLLQSYIFDNFVETWFTEEHCPLYYLIDAFIHILLSCSLLVMAFDTYLCLKNTVLHFAVSSLDSNHLKFPIYRSIAIIVSLLLTAFLLLFSDNRPHQNGLSVKDYIKISIILGIRFICILFFIASVIYLNLASINKKKLLSDFSLYLRLLVITGVISIVQNTIYAIHLVNKNKTEYDPLIEHLIYNFTNWEGFIIGVLFTFKKNTFRRKLDSSIIFRRGSRSFCTTLTPKISVVSSLYRTERSHGIHGSINSAQKEKTGV